MLPQIKGLIENTLIDWEGRIACEVFLFGCNFRCPFCHARHLVLGADSGEGIPLAAVDACIERSEGWIDGVVISGGEPTLHPGLPELIRHFRALKIGVKLDTNGSRPDVLETLLTRGLLDAVAMDVKGPLDHRYNECAGVSADLDAIRRSIELLIGSDVEYEFRTTLCPRLHDDDAVEKTALAVRGAKRLVLQRFRPINCLDPALLDERSYNEDEMRAFAELARKYVSSCAVRGDHQTPTVGGAK